MGRLPVTSGTTAQIKMVKKQWKAIVTPILEHSRSVKSLHIIWMLSTHRFHVQVPGVEMSRSGLTRLGWF